jgi:hypothetical protein
VSEDNEINGVLLAMAHGNLFYERNSVTIIFRTPGCLDEEFISWVKSRPSIRWVEKIESRLKEEINGKLF